MNCMFWSMLMNLDETLRGCVIAGPDRRALFVFTDQKSKSKYVAKNKNGKEACGVRIDGGLITSNDVKKCDYGLCIDDDRFFLIELKGKDLSRACKQLLFTFNYMRSFYPNYDYFCRIVGSSANLPYQHSYKKLLEVLQDPNKLKYKTNNLFREDI